MENFEKIKERLEMIKGASDISPKSIPKYEVSIELENLKKNIDRLTELLDILENRIYPILKHPPNVEINETEKVVPLLVQLAATINLNNNQLSTCNVRILNIIDSCQL